MQKWTFRFAVKKDEPLIRRMAKSSNLCDAHSLNFIFRRIKQIRRFEAIYTRPINLLALKVITDRIILPITVKLNVKSRVSERARNLVCALIANEFWCFGEWISEAKSERSQCVVKRKKEIAKYQEVTKYSAKRREE